jgi:hypothetical protein
VIVTGERRSLMTVSANLVIRIVFWVLGAICAFFLFRAATDVDIRPWLAVGMVSGIIGALFPWP